MKRCLLSLAAAACLFLASCSFQSGSELLDSSLLAAPVPPFKKLKYMSRISQNRPRGKFCFDGDRFYRLTFGEFAVFGMLQDFIREAYTPILKRFRCRRSGKKKR